MINHLQGAGFKIQDSDVLSNTGSTTEPDYNDYAPPTEIHEHEGEKNTRQNVTLHPKED